MHSKDLRAELIDLTMAVIAINSWNRINIAFHAAAGTYQVGQYEALQNERLRSRDEISAIHQFIDNQRYNTMKEFVLLFRQPSYDYGNAAPGDMQSCYRQ